MESSRGGGAGGSADATVDESKGKEDLKTAARILESYLSASADSLPKDLIFEGNLLVHKFRRGQISQKLIDEAMDYCNKLYKEEKVAHVKGKLFKLQEAIMNVNDCLAPLSVSEPEPPQNESRKVITFTKSLVGQIEIGHNCPTCSKNFQTFKGYQKHSREKHNVKVKNDEQSVRNRVKCLLPMKNDMLCNRVVEKVRAVQHFRESHDEPRPEKKEFRGFISSDNGKSYRVCWLEHNEDDPPDSQVIIEDEDQKESDFEMQLEDHPVYSETRGEVEESTTQIEQLKTEGQIFEKEEENENVVEDSRGISEENPASVFDSGEGAMEIEQHKVETKEEADKDNDKILMDNTRGILEVGLVVESNGMEIDQQHVVAENLEIDEQHVVAENLEIDKQHVVAENFTERLFHSSPVNDVEEVEEENFIVNVDNDGSYYILNNEEEAVNSQDSVLLSGSSTKTNLDECQMSPMSSYYRDSLAADSAHNTGYGCLEIPEEKNPTVVLQMLKNDNKIRMIEKDIHIRKLNKRKGPKIETSKSSKSARLISNEDDLEPEDTREIDHTKTLADIQTSSNVEMRIESGVDLDLLKDINVESKKEDIKDSGEENDEDFNLLDTSDVNSDSETEDEDIESSESEDEGASEEANDEDEVEPSRWEKRNNLEASIDLSSLPQNKEFISQFRSWWNASGASFVTKKKNSSSLNSSINNLFTNCDSFLNYMTSQNSSFHLSRLTSFHSEDFMPVPSPISWISEVGGKSGQDLPSRRLEMLNGHQRLRSYILFCLNEAHFEGASIQQKSAIRQHLDDLAQLVDKKKLFSQLRRLYKQQKKRREKMMSIIQPSQKENLQNCIRVWFASKESEALEIEALDIYNTSMASRYIRAKDFERFSRIAFFELAIFDKSRSGILEELRNEDYAMKVPSWVPDEMTELEFSKLPKDKRLYSPPTPDAPPSSWEMELLGDRPGFKNQADQTVCLSQRCYHLLEKMNDLKELILPQQAKMEDYLFCNSRGEKLPRMQNYPAQNNILYTFGLVTGIEKFCLKMLRKQSEGVIQSSSSLKASTKDLNSHSNKVAEESYDQMRGARRNIFLTNLGKDEGCLTLRKDKPLEDSEVKKRADRDQKQQAMMIKKAETYLEEMKSKQPWDLRPNSLQEKDVAFLKTIFTCEMVRGPQWKEEFYREVESRAGTSGDGLRALEERIFVLSRQEIESKMKAKWVGGKGQNDVADNFIVKLVKRYLELK